MKLFPDPCSYSDKRLFALDFLRGADMLVLIGWSCVGRTIGKAFNLSQVVWVTLLTFILAVWRIFRSAYGTKRKPV